MNSLLNKATVLVLNRNWQAINVRTPAEAFCQSESISEPVGWAVLPYGVDTVTEMDAGTFTVANIGADMSIIGLVFGAGIPTVTATPADPEPLNIESP